MTTHIVGDRRISAASIASIEIEVSPESLGHDPLVDDVRGMTFKIKGGGQSFYVPGNAAYRAYADRYGIGQMVYMGRRWAIRYADWCIVSGRRARREPAGSVQPKQKP